MKQTVVPSQYLQIALDIARRFVGEGRALSVSPAPDTGGKRNVILPRGAR